MKEEWVLNIQKLCREKGIPFFFKQWGGVNKKKNGRKHRGKTYDEFPVTKNISIPSRTEHRKLMAAMEQKFTGPHELQRFHHGFAQGSTQDDSRAYRPCTDWELHPRRVRSCS